MNRVSVLSAVKSCGILLAFAVLGGASRPQSSLMVKLGDSGDPTHEKRAEEPIPPPTPPPTLSSEEIALEQTSQGTRAAATLLESFDGLGAGFQGPQGPSSFRNPSDNSLAVGPDHVVQIVNSHIAAYSKKGKRNGSR